jgi:hypothetical protein
VPKLVLPKAAKAIKATLSKTEPIIFTPQNSIAVNPSAGGAGTLIAISVTDAIVDPSVPVKEKITAYLGHTALLNPTYDPNTKQIRGTVPSGMQLGAYDVVVQSSAGQIALKVAGFTCVDRPHSFVIDPVVGTSEGGFDITITGEGFRPGHMGIVIDGALIAPAIKATTDNSITFTSPQRSPTVVTFGVIDRETQLVGNLPLNSFEYVATAAISRLVPNITTVMGGDLIVVKGANFQPSDHVFVERDDGTFEEMLNTYVDKNSHRFNAPPRSKGPHAVYVVDQFFKPDPPKTRTLTYFKYTNLTADPTVMPSGTDQFDGVTNAAGDYDADGTDDLFVSRVGGAAISAVPLTRVLKNDGTGHFTDVTEDVMPDVSTTEDWRADRILLSDVNTDGYPDIFIVSNDSTALAQNASHLRILRNEPKGGSGPSANDRVFRDRTIELFPAVRTSSQLYGGGGTQVVDSWRGLDMWIGDVDKGPAGPPEILITHKELKEELDVGCGNYCASPYSSGYTYGFYWPGSRAFVWDPSKNSGQGKYKFDFNFFPRKSGVRVPIFNPPGGVVIPICNSSYGKPCRGKFTPFTGRRIAVGDLNADGKPDVAVLNDDTVSRDAVTISSLQVGINKFNSAAGSVITDVTDEVGNLGGDFRLDTIQIGVTGFPDGQAFGIMAVTKKSYAGGVPLMRLIKFKTPTIVNAVAAFEEITSASLPPNAGYDNMQASQILFRDVDADGDQDMILVCDTAPGGTEPAFRILRNERVGTQVGVLRETLRGIITPDLITSTEHLEGTALAIGDVNDDDALDFIITRATTSPTSVAPQTRVIITDK